MPFSIFEASVPVYTRRLEALSAILDKAAAYASQRKIDPAVLIQARLYPDMLPLARQVQISCSHALRASARLSGAAPTSLEDLASVIADFGEGRRLSSAEPTSLEDRASSFGDLKALIAKTSEVLKGVDPKKMQGMEDREITFPAGDGKMTLRGGDYLLHLSMPNFYFHVTTAYDILRHNGLEIGKDDFMGEA